jgi:5-methylcytosine-specific restriction endonuclease McrA
MTASVLKTGTFRCLDCETMFDTIIGRNGDRKLRCPPCWKTHESQRNAETARLWRERNREYVLTNDRARDAIRRQDPAYRARAVERARRWVKENPAGAKARDQRYYENDGPKLSAKRQRRRARLAAAPGSFTGEEFKVLCEIFEGRCFYCLEQARLTVDHVIPLSRGGSNWISNVLPACQSCNSRKNNRTAGEFMDAFYPYTQQPLFA